MDLCRPHWRSLEIEASDVEIAKQRGQNDSVAATIVFRKGKGAAFWGPYTIHARLPLPFAKDLQALISCTPKGPIFSEGEQRTLSALMKQLGFDLRSIRKGALVHLAALGVSDQDLQLLSGHKRTDTLMRYLGWGAFSATAIKAAKNRDLAERAPLGGSAQKDCSNGPAPENHTIVEPPKMGKHSGYTSNHGRRVSGPPPLVPLSPPRRLDLGLDDIDSSKWELHVKPVKTLQWAPILKLAEGTPLYSQLLKAEKWCTEDTSYNERRPLDIKTSRFAQDDIETLLAAGKIVPHTGPVLGFVNGFCVAQPKKQRRRPIFEPQLNRTLDRNELPDLQYPHRRERRAQALDAVYSIKFDFAAWFDQILLAPAVRRHFVLRTKSGLFALTRLPMGAVFAPAVAQAITWAIVNPLLDLPGVDITTMIDNVRILARDETNFLLAVEKFQQRCAFVGAQLNDTVVVNKALARQCRKPIAFLGEQYLENNMICNTQGNIDKLREAWQLFQNRSAKYSLRNFAALCGLVFFLQHTLNISLCTQHTLLRAYSSIAAEAAGLRWDSPLRYLSPGATNQLTSSIQTLLSNQPVQLPRLTPPSFSNEDFDVVIIIDASGASWGAYVQIVKTKEVWCLSQKWDSHLRHSATAEPRAVVRCMRWIATLNSSGMSARRSSPITRLSQPGNVAGIAGTVDSASALTSTLAMRQLTTTSSRPKSLLSLVRKTLLTARRAIRQQRRYYERQEQIWFFPS